MCCNNLIQALQWWRSTDRSREGLAHLQAVFESSLIYSKGKVKEPFSLFRSLIKDRCPKRGFDSLTHTMEMGNCHWMGKGRWLNLRLSNQPGRQCSPLLSLMTSTLAPFLKEESLVLHEGSNLIHWAEGNAVHMRRAYYKTRSEFMAHISKSLYAWAQSTERVPWRAGEQVWYMCWGRQTPWELL